MRHTTTIRTALAAVLAATIPLARAATTFTITDLGHLPQANTGTFAHALNGTGHIAGLSGNLFLWENGAMRNLNAALPVTPFAPARATDVNDAGTVVGWYTTSSSAATIHPFRWADGAFTDLAPSSTTPQRAVAVNGGGDILVEASPAYILHSGGTRTNLWGFSANAPFIPAALNDAGRVVGFALGSDKTAQAALWENGVSQPLGVLPGHINSAATAVNALGVVVGFSYGPTVTGTDMRPWVFENGVMTALPPRAIFESCLAVAINDRGQAVGYVGTDSRGGEKAALLWEGGKVVDLQTALPSGSGWTLRAARDINNAGQITGYGVLNNKYRAFLLTPVPPPPIPGDTNGDGAVTPQDAALVMDMAAGLAPLTNAALADIAPNPSADPRGYGDSQVDARDAILILRIAHGIAEG